MEQETKTQSFDIKDILSVLRRRRWLILVPWILAFATVVAGSYFLTPVYQAFTIVLMDRETHLSGDIQGLLGLTRGYQANDARSDEHLGGREGIPGIRAFFHPRQGVIDCNHEQLTEFLLAIAELPHVLLPEMLQKLPVHLVADVFRGSHHYRLVTEMLRQE